MFTYVLSNPINGIDPTGLICVTCTATNSGGNGYKDGVKQCIYNCKADDGRTATVKASGQDLSGGGSKPGSDQAK